MRGIVSSFVLGSILVGPAAANPMERPSRQSDALRHASAPVEVVGTPSRALTVKVLDVRPASKSTSPNVPAITAGSGATRIGSWVFVAQDDSTMLAARSDDGRYDAVRLFPPIEGADRFLDSLQNKKLKPDIEATVAVPVPDRLAAHFGVASPGRGRPVWAVLALGSGSKPKTRDRIALVFPAEPLSSSRVVQIQADALYTRLRAEPAMVGAGGELNLEGATLVDNGAYVRLFNRGNGATGSVNGSVDVSVSSLLAYLASAAKAASAPFDDRFANPKRYRLGMSSDGFPLSITDAVTIAPLRGMPRRLKGEIHIYSAVVEHISNAVVDGFTSDASLVLELPDGQVVVAPLTGVDGASSFKVEGIAVTKAEWRGAPASLHVELVGIVDMDSTDLVTPSKILSLELVFQPEAVVGGQGSGIGKR
jgi:hypothetical protein